MKMQDVESRRKYIRSIRNSFDNPERNYEWEKEERTKREAGESFSFFKLRILLSIFLFAAVVLCDQTHTTFYGYSFQQLEQAITSDYDYANIEKYVMILSQDLHLQ